MLGDRDGYAPLWCKTNFSFLEGASHPDELVEEAHHLGLRALAITDRDGLYGVVRAHLKARELGLHLILGAQVSIDDGSRLVLLCRDRTGHAQLCRLLTRGRLRSAKGESRVRWREVIEHADGLTALWGAPDPRLADLPPPPFVPSDPPPPPAPDPCDPAPPNLLAFSAPAPVDPPTARPPLDVDADAIAASLKDAFESRLYLLIARHRQPEEVSRERALRHFAERWKIPTVATTEVLYHTPARRPLQDVLTAIRRATPLRSIGRHIRPNLEHDLKSPHAFQALFADDPASVARTLEIAESCRFSLGELRYRYPSERLPDGRTSHQWLTELTYRGARQRYHGDLPLAVERQLEKELALIEELDYGGYFLTMWEIVDFCRRQQILCQGRGSAANSAVCFCLGITAIDPVRMGLLFERFLSRERAEPPDIDLDIANARREEVIQHVYEKYGRSHAAMVANVIRYRARSAIRDVGKALGYPETTLDRLAKQLSHNEAASPHVLARIGVDPRDPGAQQLRRLSDEIQDFPRHLSIHPGGFLLGHEPVHDLVPIENGSMPDRTVIQWDKDDIEALGLFKVDLLGLGALTKLDLSFQLLKAHRGLELSMETIPPDDPATYDAICRADTVGVFQIESRAQMAMLPRLRPRRYYDLVIEVSIVRPGPITGGMVHPYLRRRNGEEAIEYPHELLRPVLEKTLGVPLFQEQVMRLAVVAADYTAGEADQLRRDMAAWRKTGRMEHHRDRLIRRMEAKGIEPEFAERVFQQICGFGEYGFPESHAASFALISYASAWLKCHFPAEFTCAILNAQPMGFYSPATLVEDARRHRVVIHPIDVTASHWPCTLEPIDAPTGFAVRMGLRYVKGLAEADAQKLLGARTRAPFAGLDDLVRRTELEARPLNLLAEAGAFRPFCSRRRDAIWHVRGLLHAARAPLFLGSDSGQDPGFAPLDMLESITWDYCASSLSVRGHPLAPLRAELQAQGLSDARALSRLPHGRRVRYAGLVICRQRPGTASGVTFMTLEDETGFANLVIWTRIFARFSGLIRTAPFLGVEGKLQSAEGVVHLIAESFFEPRLSSAPRSAGSRDFH